jgi:hypothetical protein
MLDFYPAIDYGYRSPDYKHPVSHKQFMKFEILQLSFIADLHPFVHAVLST